MARGNIIPRNLLKKWRKDYKEGRSDCNPDCMDFMELYEYTERYLYNARGRSNTKMIVVINGNVEDVVGPLTSTKEYNTKFNKKNVLLDDHCFKRSEDNEDYDDKKQYVEPEPRTKDRHNNPIKRDSRLRRRTPKLRLKHKKKIKRIMDLNKKNSPSKR